MLLSHELGGSRREAVVQMYPTGEPIRVAWKKSSRAVIGSQRWYRKVVMRRSGLNESLLVARLLTPVLAVSLLFGALDLHSLLHQGQALAAGAHGEHHPEPAHLDHGSVDVPCLACLFGLKSQSRPTATPGAITRPQMQTRIAAAESSIDVAELSYRLPLSRAPPLS